jgi:hypothetical protein
VDHLLDLERLEQVVVRALLHRLDRGLDRSESGHQHGQHAEPLGLDPLEQLQARDPRHLEIGDQQVVGPQPELGQRLLAVLDGVDRETLEREELREDLADHALVVDDQDARSVAGFRGHTCAGRARGGVAAHS